MCKTSQLFAGIGAIVLVFTLVSFYKEYEIRKLTRDNFYLIKRLNDYENESQKEIMELTLRLDELNEKTKRIETISMIQNGVFDKFKVWRDPQIFDIIIEKSEEHNLSPAFLLSWIHQESSFRPYLENGSHHGLLQINVDIWEPIIKFSVDMIFDPGYNIDIAVAILNRYESRTGDIDTALHWFNNGPSGKYNNTKYVTDIRAREKMYEKILYGEVL